MKSPAFHAEAPTELEAEIRFYEMQRSGFGPRFHAAVMSAVSRAGQFPESGVAERDGVRKQLIHKFPFLDYHELLNDRIVIWAVMQAARKPGYWRHRRTPASPP
ncbi:MAG: type II toxin-antitoxin system RelE/ParE family toxin [Opitutus sp.]|nr:type II toxin-antitoxin system RelE/ParE family toxin [Opitutus sp.]